MKKHQMRLVTVIKALCLLSVISASELYAASLDDVLGVRSSTTVEGAKSQAKIDEVTEQTRDLLQQFKTVMKVVDGLQVYNQQQRRLIKNQEDELGELEESIDNVTVIERQIGPLIEKMIVNLEKFVELDIPFLITERRERIDFHKDTLDRADVSVAENTFCNVSGFTKTYFETFPFAENTFRDVSGLTKTDFVMFLFAKNSFRFTKDRLG